LEFLGLYGSRLSDVSFLDHTPNLKRLVFSGRIQTGKGDNGLLVPVLKIIPSLKWLNGAFVSAARKRESLQPIVKDN